MTSLTQRQQDVHRGEARTQQRDGGRKARPASAGGPGVGDAHGGAAYRRPGIRGTAASPARWRGPRPWPRGCGRCPGRAGRPGGEGQVDDAGVDGLDGAGRGAAAALGPERLAEVPPVQGAGHETVGGVFHPLGGQPAHEMAGIFLEGAHRPGRHVEQVALRARAVGDALAHPACPVHHHHVHGWACVPQQVGGDQGTTGAAADDGHHGRARSHPLILTQLNL